MPGVENVENGREHGRDREPGGGIVLVVEDDGALGGLVREVLAGEGYAVSVLGDVTQESVRDAVARLEPDCVLLDSEGMASYDQSWEDAMWAHARDRPIPVVMFTADPGATAEALAAETERSRRAAFFAVIAKPFQLDDLLDVVARAVAAGAARSSRQPARADRSGTPHTPKIPCEADAARRLLLERLRQEVTAIQEDLRLTRIAIGEITRDAAGRRTTPEERRALRELTLRMEAQGLRLHEIRRAVDARGGGD